MQVTLSAAVTADGYLDDCSPTRQMISTPEDWAAVMQLRSRCDAILVGAETLRRDNPTLLLRDDLARQRRVESGLRPDLTKVTLTRSGRLDASLRFFTEGDADCYVFSPHEINDIKGLATIIETEGSATASQIVTQLEKRGIRHLLVEGGAHILRLFLAEGMADTLRLATNPTLRFGHERGGAHFAFTAPAATPCHHEELGGMLVDTYTLRPNTAESDRHYLRLAVNASRQCTPEATSYCVGAVVVTPSGELFTGYTHETSPTHHAEQEAIAKALACGATLRGAAIYSSMEPCSRRASEPESCTQLILRHGFSHVAFALYEPDCFVCCRGAQTLREAGLDVRHCPEWGDEVRAINAHLWK